MFDYWAGASFLSALVPDQSPRFHGGHLEGGVVLVEDVGNNMSVVDALAGSDPIEAERELVDLAKCLGTIHAKSVGKEPQYLEVRSALSSNKEQVSFRDSDLIKINLVKLRQTVSSLDLEISAEAERDIQTVIDSLENPGKFLAFIHRDPIPPNFMRTDRGLVTIDLEFSGYGHALTDVMSFRMGFPTYGLPGRLPSQVIETFESNYRSAFAEGCDAANHDDVYHPASVEACAWWLMFELIPNLEKTTDEAEIPEDQKNRMSEGRKWIITRLMSFIEISLTTDHLGGLRTLCQELHAKLAQAWDSEAIQLEYYPAFSDSQTT
jgi:thiamine kinase-like enzyme